MISQRSVNHILETARIEEVIGDYVRLKKNGSNMIGLCPFHNEKTPSFSVSPSKGIYKCFGCGAAGNVSKFIMEHDRMTYWESLRLLAERYQIEIEETNSESPEERAEENLKESLLVANGFAQKFYADFLLNSDEGQSVGMSYFTERGFRDDTIKKFQLGFSPSAEIVFYKAAIDAAYNADILMQAGLIAERHGKKVDFFRERVLFPIHNLSGKVIGFGGRTLRSDKNIPKYLNTAQTAVYDKSKSLYGIFFARNAIRKADECILVEGYTDVISLSQSGIENVVASSGTSLTHEQARLIRRMTQNIVILYDGDPAGLKAALRGIDILLEEDLNVRVVALPENDDPDSFVKTNGALALKEFIAKNISDFILFKTKLLLSETNNDPFKKAEVIKDIIASVAVIPDPIKRTLFLKSISEMMQVDEQVLVSEINKLKRAKLTKDAAIPRRESELLGPQETIAASQHTPEVLGKMELQEGDVIRLLIKFGSLNLEFKAEEQMIKKTVAETIVLEMEAENIVFENAVFKKILNEFREALQRENIPDEKYFIHHQDEEIRNFAVELLTSPYQISENWEKRHGIMITEEKFMLQPDIISSLTRFKLMHLQKRIHECKLQLKATSNESESEKLIRRLNRYLKLKKNLALQLGTVVMR